MLSIALAFRLSDYEYDTNNTHWFDHGEPRTQGQFKFYQDFIERPQVSAIEGLIVSTTDSPGIGLRNHTLPPASELGYAWTEQILWLEPETACTNLNITFDNKVPKSSLQSNIKGSLVDRGGFVAADSAFRNISREHRPGNTQNDPDLLEKSRQAAVLTNVFILFALNQSREHWNDSFVGKEYPINGLSTYDDNGSLQDARRISLSFFGSGAMPVAATDMSKGTWSPNLPGPLLWITNEGNLNVETEFISIGRVLFHFTSVVLLILLIDLLVQAASNDTSSITLAGTVGGLVLGVGSEVDANGDPINDSDHFRIEQGTKQSR